jgi:hypothetical protein
MMFSMAAALSTSGATTAAQLYAPYGSVRYTSGASICAASVCGHDRFLGGIRNGTHWRAFPDEIAMSAAQE